jgi:hypothetical protein
VAKVLVYCGHLESVNLQHVVNDFICVVRRIGEAMLDDGIGHGLRSLAHQSKNGLNEKWKMIVVSV